MGCAVCLHQRNEPLDGGIRWRRIPRGSSGRPRIRFCEEEIAQKGEGRRRRCHLLGSVWRFQRLDDTRQFADELFPRCGSGKYTVFRMPGVRNSDRERDVLTIRPMAITPEIATTLNLIVWARSALCAIHDAGRARSIAALTILKAFNCRFWRAVSAPLPAIRTALTTSNAPSPPSLTGMSSEILKSVKTRMERRESADRQVVDALVLGCGERSTVADCEQKRRKNRSRRVGRPGGSSSMAR